MNLGDIKRRTFAQLRDTPRAFADEGDVEDFINDAYIDLATRLELLQNEVTGTWAGTELPLPDGTPDPEPVEVKDLAFGTSHVVWVDDQTFWDYKDNALTPPETIGRVFGGSIELYPVPVVGTAYTLRYTYMPAILDTPDDTPLLPTHLHIKLVYYALFQTKLKFGDQEEAQVYLTLYEQGLPPVVKGRVTQLPSPLSFFPELGPFDLDPMAKHI